MLIALTPRAKRELASDERERLDQIADVTLYFCKHLLLLRPERTCSAEGDQLLEEGGGELKSCFSASCAEGLAGGDRQLQFITMLFVTSL